MNFQNGYQFLAWVFSNPKLQDAFNRFMAVNMGVINYIRKLRAEYNIPKDAILPFSIRCPYELYIFMVHSHFQDNQNGLPGVFTTLCGAEPVRWFDPKDPDESWWDCEDLEIPFVVQDAIILLTIPMEYIDVDKEEDKINRAIDKLNTQIKAKASKLTDTFIASAPPDIVTKEQQAYQDMVNRWSVLFNTLVKIGVWKQNNK